MGRETPALASGLARVELRLAGAFTVMLDGSTLTEQQVGSRKSRTLLKLLAARRPGLVPAEQIADVLWDGQPPEGADRNIASLVSRLRAVLGAGVIDGGRTGYRLGGEAAVSVDLDAAARLLDQADRNLASSPASALAAAERAARQLSAGEAIAEEPYAHWAEPARLELRQSLRRARLIAAQAALATAQPELASRHAEAAMTADDLDEAAYRWYMASTAGAGERARALRAYADLRQRLAEELGTDPTPQTRELHLAILREESGTALLVARGATAGAGLSAAADDGPGQVATAPALVGRDSELATLRAAWRRTADRELSLVLIAGEAGIGKTTLAEVLAVEAAGSGATVLRARCYETERSLFLQPIVEAVTPVVSRLSAASLRELLGGYAPVVAALVPAAAEALGPASPDRGDAQLARRRAFEAVTTLLRGLAERDPVLLFVDDLQCAGQSTVELLHFLGRQLTGSRILIVTTVRAEQIAEIGSALDPVATRLELGPLAVGAVEQLATQAGQGTHTAEIIARTRGHTLFVVEVLRALDSGDTGLPESLRAVVQGRVERAGQQVAGLLRAASVLGTTVDPLTVAALLDLPPATAVDLCEQALRARLFAVSGRDYEFANDLIREVLYGSTPEPSRLAYHRRAADLLSRHPESLARHAAAAGDWPRAARAWLLAADEALAGYAASDAVALAAEALDAANRAGGSGPSEKDAAELRGRALVLRGRAREAAGDLEPALADLIEGARMAHESGDRRLELHALRQLGGDASQGLRAAGYTTSLGYGLSIAESLGDYASQADLLSRMGIVAANRLRLGTALSYGERAAIAGRAARDERALAAGLDGLKLAYLCVGDLHGLATVLAELLPLVRRQTHGLMRPWVEFEAAYLAVATGDLDRAVAEMAAALQLTSQLGYPQSAAWFTAHLGWLARVRGDYAHATEFGLRAVQIAEQYAHGWWRSVALAQLGETVLTTGDRLAAIGYLERGAAQAREAGIEGFLLRCLAPLAKASGSEVLLTEAARLLDGADIPAGRAWLLGYESYLWLARAWLDRDEPGQARSVLAPLIDVARREPWITALAAALAVDGRALLRLGQRTLAEEQLQTARHLADEHGLRPVRREADDALLGAG